MAIGEHYSVKLFGLALAEQLLNVFAYRQTSGVALQAAQDLAFEFDQHVLGSLIGIIGDYMSLPRLETFAIETPTDYDDRVPINNVGVRNIGFSERPPSYLAAGFRSNRAGAGSRASYKRFCGMSEDDSDANALTATYLALVLASGLSNSLSLTLTAASGNVFVPVQLKSGWIIGGTPVENFEITSFGTPYLTSQVSRRP